jgi:DNA-binding CsgD family transcriptional regulator
MNYKIYAIKEINSNEIKTGSKNHKAILTENQVIEIREMYKNVITQKEISIIYNINPPMAYKIVHRINWKHI